MSHALLKGKLLPPQGYTTDEKALNQFQLYVAAVHAGPMILIKYLEAGVREHIGESGESDFRSGVVLQGDAMSPACAWAAPAGRQNDLNDGLRDPGDQVHRRLPGVAQPAGAVLQSGGPLDLEVRHVDGAVAPVGVLRTGHEEYVEWIDGGN